MWLLTLALAGNVQVDPDVELGFVVLRMAGFDEYQSPAVPADVAAPSEALLAPHVTEAVERARALRPVLHSSNAGQLLVRGLDLSTREARHVDRRHARELVRWARAVRAAGEAAGWATHMAAQQLTHHRIVAAYDEALPDDVLPWLSEIVGHDVGSDLTVLVSQHGGQVALGTSIGTGPDRRLRPILSALPTGPDPLYDVPTLVHEVAHGTTGGWFRASGLTPLAEVVLASRSAAYPSYYADAGTLLEETYVRALASLYVRERYPEAVLHDRADNDIEGFYWVEEVTDAFARLRAAGTPLAVGSPQVDAAMGEGLQAWLNLPEPRRRRFGDHLPTVRATRGLDAATEAVPAGMQVTRTADGFLLLGRAVGGDVLLAVWPSDDPATPHLVRLGDLPEPEALPEVWAQWATYRRDEDRWLVVAQGD